MPKLLSEKDFLESFELVPRLAVSLVVTNEQGNILLTSRAIPPQIGAWHMPGSFILKGETITQCIRRILKTELGLTIKSSDAELLGAFDNLTKDPRGHVVDLIYRIKTNKLPKITPETKNFEFFDTLPRRIGFNHRTTLRKLGY